MKPESRKKIIDLVKAVYDKLDPSGKNTAIIVGKLTAMPDIELKKFIERLRNKEDQFSLEMPNGKQDMKMYMPLIYEAADMLGVELFEHLHLVDRGNGIRYRTKHKYPILTLPIRRAQQSVKKKMSIPDGHMRVDHISGQVSGDAQAAGIGKEEWQIIDNRGLHACAGELAIIRGGNPELLSQYSRELEETGEADIDTTDPTHRTRISQVIGIMLRGIHLDSTL